MKMVRSLYIYHVLPVEPVLVEWRRCRDVDWIDGTEANDNTDTESEAEMEMEDDDDD
jgi:hypothetical protein